MYIFANYFVHSFLIVLIIVFYILILYFNIKAVEQKLKNKVVNVLGSPPSCTYTDIDVIPDKQKCKDNNYYITEDDLTFTLSTIQTNYKNVCKELCTTYDDKSPQPCKGNVGYYNNCIKILAPLAGCNGLERPLGYRFDSGSNEKVNLYAKNYTQLNNCI